MTQVTGITLQAYLSLMHPSIVLWSSLRVGGFKPTRPRTILLILSVLSKCFCRRFH